MEQEIEKLSINERKIIDILLKQLMNIQNEFAYFKNKVGLQLSNNAITDFGDGGNIVLDAIGKNEDGGNIGPDAIGKKEDGGNIFLDAIAKNEDGGNSVSDAIAKNEDGGNIVLDAIAKKEDGGNFVLDAIAKKEDGGNSDIRLYADFEQQLSKALKQYITNSDGQNSLYAFYKNFEQSVTEKNRAIALLKESKNNLILEDTHYLPAQIPYNNDTVLSLTSALRPHLLKNVPAHTLSYIVSELLLLHNLGKAKAKELRGLTNQAESGMSKHLLRLQKIGFIKKQPPGNYVLTDKSKHILLETFGIPKNNATL
jgi:hypothetical protein